MEAQFLKLGLTVDRQVATDQDVAELDNTKTFRCLPFTYVQCLVLLVLRSAHPNDANPDPDVLFDANPNIRLVFFM